MPRNEKNKNLGVSPTVPLFSTPFNVIIGCLWLSNWRGKLSPNNPIIWRATIFSHSPGPWSFSWLSSSRLSKHMNQVVSVSLCLFVFCVFVSWLLVQCQPGEQTSISRCRAQVPSKRTKTSIARCLFSSFYFFELRFQENNKEDEDVARAAELNQRCWSM